MSKFCENCGSEMDDNQTVCPNCGAGADVQDSNPINNDPISETTNTTPQSNNIKKIAIFAGIIAVVAVVIAIVVSIFGSGWKKPIKNYFKSMEKADAEMQLSAYPDFMAEKMKDYITDSSMEKQLEDLEDEYGSNIKISYKIKSKDKIKKDDLAKVQKYIKKYYEQDDVKVTAGYKVKVSATIKGSDDKETDTNTVYVYKIDGKWSYFDVSPSDAKDYLDDNDD